MHKWLLGHCLGGPSIKLAYTSRAFFSSSTFISPTKLLTCYTINVDAKARGLLALARDAKVQCLIIYDKPLAFSSSKPSNVIMEHKISPPSSNPQLTTPEWVSQHINHQGVDVVHPPLNQQVTHIKPPISQIPAGKTLNDLCMSNDYEPGEVDWVVDKLFDVGRLHMICGPAVSGKTRIILKMIDDIQNGRPFMGLATTRKKCILIDGVRDRLSMKVAMRSLGIEPASIPFIPFIEHKLPLETLLNTFVPPDTELIVIDNLAMMIGDYARSSDPTLSNAAVSKFLGNLKTRFAKELKTGIFTHSMLKQETGSKYLSQKNKIAGSGMWLTNVETALIIDEENPQDISDPYRVVTTILHNHKHGLNGRYELKDDGRLYKAPKTHEDDIRTSVKSLSSKALALWQRMPINEPRALDSLRSESQLPRATFFRCIRELSNKKMIEKTREGYIRVG